MAVREIEKGEEHSAKSHLRGAAIDQFAVRDGISLRRAAGLRSGGGAEEWEKERDGDSGLGMQRLATSPASRDERASTRAVHLPTPEVVIYLDVRPAASRCRFFFPSKGGDSPRELPPSRGFAFPSACWRVGLLARTCTNTAVAHFLFLSFPSVSRSFESEQALGFSDRATCNGSALSQWLGRKRKETSK